jgi:NAD+ diphosphatase
VAQARALLDWHAHHEFCSSCGSSTRAAQGGALRFCADCRTEHFPRVNPVVISVVVRGEECLLGRGSGWPAGMFSALAGFVEAGETLEDAVRREILEESAIRVGEVRYLRSQPWPFPSSLMMGCIAEALSSEIRVDSNELEDARWFGRDRVLAALAGKGDGFFVPPALSIAHHIVRAWAEGRA